MKKFLVGILVVFLISTATAKFANAMTDDNDKKAGSFAGLFVSSGTTFGQKYSSIGGFIGRTTDKPIEGENKFGGVLYFGLEVLKPENFDHFTKGYTVYTLACFFLNKESWCQFYWGAGLGIGLRYNKLKEDMDDWVVVSVPVGIRIGELSILGNNLSLRIQTGPRVRTSDIFDINIFGSTWGKVEKGNFWHLEISLENRL